jgi:hypothetical protein
VINESLLQMKYYILILVLLIAQSCGVLGKTTEKISKTETVETENKETVKDTSSDVQTNKKIDDVIATAVPVSENPEVNKELISLLKRMNTQKTSGDNSYKRYYDEKTNQLIEEFKIGQTASSEIATSTDTLIEKTFSEQVDEYFKQTIKKMPWYVYLLVGIFLWPYIWKVLRPILLIAMGPASIGTILKDQFKPKL